MNLFINILLVYFLPILLYTLGRNEYMENANEHRLSQHRTLDPEESIAISNVSSFHLLSRLYRTCSSYRAEIYY